MQKVPGATQKLVQKEIDKAVKEQRKTKKALGVANYANRVKKAVAAEASKKKSKKNGKKTTRKK